MSIVVTTPEAIASAEYLCVIIGVIIGAVATYLWMDHCRKRGF
jgi:hypothetical protein